MFEIKFYKDKDGRSPIINYLDDLKRKSERNKDSKINREKILSYLAALSQYGTRIGKPFVKHIEGDIWELRPLRNRIFFFYWKDNTFVLLHFFVKKTQKTPSRELEKAQRNLLDFLKREDMHEGD